MGIRRSLATAGLCGVLAIGSGLVGGCSSSGMNSFRATQSAPYYVQLEDRVYAFVDGFSREIPSSFVKMEGKDSYHDATLQAKDGPNANINDATGAGRFVTRTPGSINAGYMDTDEAKRANNTGDATQLKRTIGFIRKLDASRSSFGIMDDYLSIMEGNQCVMYIKIDGIWRRKALSFRNLKQSSVGGLDTIRAFPSVSGKKVQRFIELSDRLDATYFNR